MPKTRGEWLHTLREELNDRGKSSQDVAKELIFLLRNEFECAESSVTAASRDRAARRSVPVNSESGLSNLLLEGRVPAHVIYERFLNKAYPMESIFQGYSGGYFERLMDNLMFFKKGGGVVGIDRQTGQDDPGGKFLVVKKRIQAAVRTGNSVSRGMAELDEWVEKYVKPSKEYKEFLARDGERLAERGSRVFELLVLCEAASREEMQWEGPRNDALYFAKHMLAYIHEYLGGARFPVISSDELVELIKGVFNYGAALAEHKGFKRYTPMAIYFLTSIIEPVFVKGSLELRDQPVYRVLLKSAMDVQVDVPDQRGGSRAGSPLSLYSHGGRDLTDATVGGVTSDFVVFCMRALFNYLFVSDLAKIVGNVQGERPEYISGHIVVPLEPAMKTITQITRMVGMRTLCGMKAMKQFGECDRNTLLSFFLEMQDLFRVQNFEELLGAVFLHYSSWRGTSVGEKLRQIASDQGEGCIIRMALRKLPEENLRRDEFIFYLSAMSVIAACDRNEWLDEARVVECAATLNMAAHSCRLASNNPMDAIYILKNCWLGQRGSVPRESRQEIARYFDSRRFYYVPLTEPCEKPFYDWVLLAHPFFKEHGEGFSMFTLMAQVCYIASRGGISEKEDGKEIIRKLIEFVSGVFKDQHEIAGSDNVAARSGQPAAAAGRAVSRYVADGDGHSDSQGEEDDVSKEDVVDESNELSAGAGCRADFVVLEIERNKKQSVEPGKP